MKPILIFQRTTDKVALSKDDEEMRSISSLPIPAIKGRGLTARRLKFIIVFSLLTSCSSTRITYEVGEEINLGTVKAAPKEVKRGRGLISNYGDTYSLWDALFAEPSKL